MRRVLAWIILAPLAVIAILFAVANRRSVTVSLDPFSSDAPAYSVELPMFLIIFSALILGVLIGGTAVWFGRLRWQMAAHRAEREVAKLKAENATMAARASPDFPSVRTLPPPGDRAPLG
jgi:uncharacterized integral membrane protein